MHGGEHQEEVSGGGQAVSVVFGEGGEEVLHVGEEGVFLLFGFGGEDEGVEKYGLFQDFFAGGAVEACPGVTPGGGVIGAVVDGAHGADEESVTGFQMVGVAAALVDAFALGNYVEEVVRAHGRAEGVAGAAVFLAAEVDGEGVLWVGFFFHVFGVPPVFLCMQQKRNFGSQNGVGLLYGLIIQYGGGKGKDVGYTDAREVCAACRRGFVGGWLLSR